ncbi:MAG TPA: hypothetical protein VHS31_03765 [Tepidisphaeraceae bacterium]|nr:hypothetical protein [Tepidisphaeraceae bacterium]
MANHRRCDFCETFPHSPAIYVSHFAAIDSSRMDCRIGCIPVHLSNQLFSSLDGPNAGGIDDSGALVFFDPMDNPLENWNTATSYSFIFWNRDSSAAFAACWRRRDHTDKADDAGNRQASNPREPTLDPNQP